MSEVLVPEIINIAVAMFAAAATWIGKSLWDRVRRNSKHWQSDQVVALKLLDYSIFQMCEWWHGGAWRSVSNERLNEFGLFIHDTDPNYQLPIINGKIKKLYLSLHTSADRLHETVASETFTLRANSSFRSIKWDEHDWPTSFEGTPEEYYHGVLTKRQKSLDQAFGDYVDQFRRFENAYQQKYASPHKF